MHKCQWTSDKNNVKKCNEFEKGGNLCVMVVREDTNATDRCNFKSFYQTLRSVFILVSNESTPIFSSDGNLIAYK